MNITKEQADKVIAALSMNLTQMQPTHHLKQSKPKHKNPQL